MGNSRSETGPTVIDYDYNDMNFSQTDFIDTIWTVKPPSQIIIEVTIFAPIVLFGLFGNILSIYILAINKHIRTPTNLLIGNMAFADLLSLASHPWVVLVYDLCQNYILGEFGCKSEGAFECSAMVASVISVSAISYDRLTAIVARSDKAKLTKGGAKVCMGVAWLAGLGISAPLAIYRTYRERQWRNFLEKFCKENALIINTYWFVIISVLVWLPLTIQLICYVAIFVKLNKYEKVTLKKLESRQMNYKKKAIRMMCTVIVTFMLCRIPFTVLILYRYEAIKDSGIDTYSAVSSEYHTFWFVAKLLIFVNAALNPLIYSVTNEKFRRGFKTTHLSKWLFPPQRAPTSTQQTRRTGNNVGKTIETTSLFRNNLFFIFWARKERAKDIQNGDQGRSGQSHEQLNIHL